MDVCLRAYPCRRDWAGTSADRLVGMHGTEVALYVGRNTTEQGEKPPLVQDAAIMKNVPVLMVCLALAGGITSPVHSLQETTPSRMAVREVVEELKQVYSTDIRHYRK